MSRPCAESAAVGAEMLATVAVAVAALRHHLTDPDPKTALRAVAELTKLLSVCARHGLAAGATEDADVVPPPAPEPGRTRERRSDGTPAVAVPGAADSAEVLCSLRERSSFADQEPLAERAEYGMPLPGGRGPQVLPPGGRTLTSFLGVPTARTDAG